jgi:putative membrane protein
MSIIANLLVAAVALLHGYILVLEMFLWTTPTGLRAFGQTLEQAKASAVLAANQGLYNGFLAAGLIWGIWLGEGGDPVKIFFLLCVAVAGAYGAATVSMRILMIQTLPALIALVAVIYM